MAGGDPNARLDALADTARGLPVVTKAWCTLVPERRRYPRTTVCQCEEACARLTKLVRLAMASRMKRRATSLALPLPTDRRGGIC
jgi:hypothetical protein